MLFGIEFSPELHQQLVNVLLLLQVAVDSRGSHTCTLAWLQHRCAFLGCKHNVAERNPLHNAAAALVWRRGSSARRPARNSI